MTSVSWRVARRMSFIVFSAGLRRAVVPAAALVLPALPLGRAADAQTSPSGLGLLSDAGPLLLGDLYSEARRTNPRIEAARALSRAAEARIPGSRRPPDPEVQLGLMNRSLPSFGPMEPLGMTQLQLMQMVPTAGKSGLAGRIATAQAAAQHERAEEIALAVRSQVAMAFYDLYQSERALAIDRESLRLLNDTRAVAEAMYRAGEGRQADVLRAGVEIARMIEDTIRMSAMRTIMAARLNSLLDRPDSMVPGVPVLPGFPESVPDLEVLADGIDGRPMVRAGLREIEAANVRAELARREIWPDVTIGVQLASARVNMPPESIVEGEPVAFDRRTERMASVMIGATVPIFARSRQLRMREETSAMRRMAEADLLSMRAETRGNVAEAHAVLTRARRLASLYRTTILPQAEATVASSQAAYRVGSVDFMTLLDSRMSVNEYRKELAALEADEGKAWAELEMLLGRELFDASRVVRDHAVTGGAR